jgi:hypothetical protein
MEMQPGQVDQARTGIQYKGIQRGVLEGFGEFGESGGNHREPFHSIK